MFDQLPNPAELQRGTPLTASMMRAIVTAIRKNISVAPPLTMTEGIEGILLGLGKEILNDVITLKNDSMGDSVPAYAVVAAKDVVDSSRRVLVEKPSEGPASYLVNGPGEIPGGGGGYAQTTELIRILYDDELTGDDKPMPGEVFGPISDEWFIGRDTAVPIFKVLGIVDEERTILLAEKIDPPPVSAVLDEELEQGSHATATIRRRTFGTDNDEETLEETDVEIEVFDSTLGDDDQSLPADTPIIAQLQGDGRYYVVTAGCSTIERAEEEEEEE